MVILILLSLCLFLSTAILLAGRGLDGIVFGCWVLSPLRLMGVEYSYKEGILLEFNPSALFNISLC